MKDDSNAILNDVLGRWHAWAKGFSIVPVCSADPMFRDVRSRGGWDSADDIMDMQINAKIMKSVDFEVGEMLEPHRSAIYAVARNLHMGAAVWSSPRLPADPLARGVIVVEAKRQITKRLIVAGVL